MKKQIKVEKAWIVKSDALLSCLMKSRNYNPAKYCLDKIVKLSTHEIKYEWGCFLLEIELNWRNCSREREVVQGLWTTGEID